MPYTVKNMGGRSRVVKKDTGNIAKNAGGMAMDGGGYSSPGQAKKQITAVNMSKAGKKGLIRRNM